MPSRFDLTLEYVREFVAEWFDQNPLGQVRRYIRAHAVHRSSPSAASLHPQIGITGLRSGVAEQLTEMGGVSDRLSPSSCGR